MGWAVTEEQTFLSAIMAAPDDHTLKLVYADWLDERDDPRAEILRLKVQVASLADGWPAARDRLAELEPTVPPTWLVQLDGPVWCLTGNVVASRPYGPGGHETRQGTRLFKPNARVYLASSPDGHFLLAISPEERLLLPPLPLPEYRICVVGRHRKSLDWIKCIVPSELTTNWRVELVYQPGVLAKLKKEGWGGFTLRRGDFVCPANRSSREAISGLLRALGIPGGNESAV